MSDDIDPQRLWLRVLLVGLVDAYECMHDDNIFKSTDDLDWLASPDFEEICHYVERNPEDMRRLVHHPHIITRLKFAVGWLSTRDVEHADNRRSYTRARESEAEQIGLFV